MMLRGAKGLHLDPTARALAVGTSRTDRSGDELARDGTRARPNLPIDPKPSGLEESQINLGIV